MKEENIEFNELEKSLLNIKQLTEKMSKTLESVDGLIKDNINNGSGVWDSQTAELYRSRWDLLSQEFPTIIETFSQQEENLNQFITNMKKTEEA